MVGVTDYHDRLRWRCSGMFFPIDAKDYIGESPTTPSTDAKERVVVHRRLDRCFICGRKRKPQRNTLRIISGLRGDSLLVKQTADAIASCLDACPSESRFPSELSMQHSLSSLVDPLFGLSLTLDASPRTPRSPSCPSPACPAI